MDRLLGISFLDISRKKKRMEDLPNVSEALYVRLCCDKSIGTEREVTIRRELMDMDELIQKSLNKHIGRASMKSGSSREGFRFKSSDQDTMMWRTANKVICELSQGMFLDGSIHNIILMEHSGTPQGFVKLELLTPARSKELVSAVVVCKNRCYISSQRFRSHHYQRIKKSTEGTPHGPCFNLFLDGIEGDIGTCLFCQYWPQTALPWIERCHEKNWPAQCLLEKILSNGCHVMPIESKSESDENEFEWRLSFSQAEQKLVYSMNHTQFLCYGVLKIFLKDVLRLDKEGLLLCSYFLKTVLFWEIQNNPNSVFWCITSLLSCFWMCFKRLCKCVLDSYCPNFFIPQNNMFANKIFGASREALLSKLIGYYEMGVACLQLSPYLNSILAPALRNPLYDVGYVILVSDIDNCIRLEIQKKFRSVKYIEEVFFYLKSISSLSQMQLSEYQLVKLRHDLADVLVQTAFKLANQFESNKTWYGLEKMITYMLRLSANISTMTYALYLAIYYYRTGQYIEVLKLATVCKFKFTQPHVTLNAIEDVDGYVQFVHRFSMNERMKRVWMDFICFNNDIVYLSELRVEEIIQGQNARRFLFIPPFVLVHMLCVLSNVRLGDMAQSLLALKDLKILLLSNNRTHVPLRTRDISWQILGICQRVVGDLHGALQSFQQTLRQDSYHKLHDASRYRIAFILNQITKKH